ncbi:sortase domain-bontaining protein [Cryobacterium sp. HLT2-28]|uniref:sortase domain-containing protein n=1 Tax=Cryobacterium sp. HLT2-28 TaxID=1259146 RepID=UPI00106DCD07|nr:sortase [Cryobacterium sp. HLT2-28]TFB95943.1 sortase [Cryobacterium sp. HLT2-28]
MRATVGAIGMLAVALVLLSGCSGAQVPPASAPTAVTTPAPASVLPPPRPAPEVTVPTVSATLSANQAPAPLPPVRIRVETLGIDMAVEAVGQTAEKVMELPKNPAVAAWYRFGPSPASPAGATVIAAHVDSLVYDIGPFARLASATAGTRVVLTLSDGSERGYSVTGLQSILKPDVPWDSVFDRSGASRLTLVTCGGEFDYEAKRYLSNVIVSADPLP